MDVAVRHSVSITRALVTALLMMLALTAYGELSVTQGSAQSGASAGHPSARQSTASLQDWTYSLRPGETLPQVADRLLSYGHSLSQLLSYNTINSASAIQPGDAIRIPIAWLQRRPEPALALTVTGPVQHVSGATGRRQPLQSRTAIRAGDELISKAGTAVIQLADGSIIRLDQNSQLAFNHLNRYGKTGMVDTRLRLNRGALETDVEPLMDDGSRFELRTPSAVAAVRGTAFRLAANAGTTELQVTEGSVAFGPPGRTRNIPAGYGATAGNGTGNAVDIRKLPPAPDAAPLPKTITRLPQDLKWSALPGIRNYQIEISSAETGHRVSRTRTSAPHSALTSLDNGRYHVKLAAIDHRGNLGMWQEQTVDVAQQAKPAQLLQPANAAGIDEQMPVFSWSYAGDNETGRLEIAADTSFANPVATSEWISDNSAVANRPLEPGRYFWRVVTETGGNSVAMSEPRTFSINGALPPAHIININYVDNEVHLFWASVPSATDYRLQLAEDPGFNNVIKQANVAKTNAALRLIPGRRYFVRLKALSDGPASGLWGPGRELFVN